MSKVSKRSRLVFAADVGGTHVRAAVVDQCGQVLHRTKQNTPHTSDPEEIVELLVNAVKGATTDQSEQISGVSVVVPGTVDAEHGTIVKAPNVSCLDGFDLTSALTAELGWPSVIENDANAAAVGEMWLGAGRGKRTIVCITLGTGVGGGIILNEKLWRGVDGAAAEIGHMCVDPFGGVPCGCGSNGCLEVYASATALVRMAQEAKPRYSKSILQRKDGLTAKTIFDAGMQGDELALEVFQRMGKYLGIGVANLINILNPEMIVIGGGVIAGWELFEKSLRQQVAERAFPLLAGRVRIVRGECGDDAGLLGAARLSFDK